MNKTKELSTELLSKILEDLPIGFLLLEMEDPNDDKSFRILKVNKAGSAASGTDMSQYYGQTLFEAFPTVYEQRPGLIDFYVKTIATQEPVEIGEIEYGDDKIEKTLFLITAYPLTKTHLYLCYTSVTAQRAAERKTEEKYQELERMNKLMVDRELKMTELKKKIKALTKK
jgi:hypothetical protein